MLPDLEPKFLAAVTSDGTRTDSDAHAEWIRMVEGAERKVALDPPTPATPSTPPPQQRPPIYELGGIIFDEPDEPPLLWGDGSDGLAIEGEGTMVMAPTGVGKTTILQHDFHDGTH